MNWRVRKRVFDLCVALLILLPVAVVSALVGLLVWLCHGKPIFFVSERMRSPGNSFGLIKFRTMRPAACDGGVVGGDNLNRITRLGRFLRRTRLDELPQIINVLRGEMSFVGPRPPVRKYVEAFPQIYSNVLSVPVGITGVATLYFHGREASLLGRCVTRDATEDMYQSHCLPIKARLDQCYARQRSLWRDLIVMVLTIGSIFGVKPDRVRKRWNLWIGGVFSP